MYGRICFRTKIDCCWFLVQEQNFHCKRTVSEGPCNLCIRGKEGPKILRYGLLDGNRRTTKSSLNLQSGGTMATMLFRLPTELIVNILALALEDSPIPSSILCVSSTFLAVSQPLLHSHLRFRSSRQLNLFSAGRWPLVCPTRYITIILPGASAHPSVFDTLGRALGRCKQYMGDGQVPLDVLRLQLNSHTRDPNLVLVREALSMAK